MAWPSVSASALRLRALGADRWFLCLACASPQLRVSCDPEPPVDVPQVLCASDSYNLPLPELLTRPLAAGGYLYTR